MSTKRSGVGSGRPAPGALKKEIGAFVGLAFGMGAVSRAAGR